MIYKTDYWDSPEFKREFNRFLFEIHNLDLTLWDQMGYWDNNYRPFSYFHDGSIMSNVCVYSMDMIVNGQRAKVAQISGVGTSTQFRKRGLSRDLTEKAIKWGKEKHDFFFLFADQDAFPFYEKCGFTRVAEYKSRCAIDGNDPVGKILKLDANNSKHLELIFKIASDREPVSNKLGVFTEKLMMFWCLYFLRDNIYYIKDLELLVLLGRETSILKIYDLAGSNIPEFSEIYPYISEKSDTAVEFFFMADKMNMKNIEQVEISGNGTHIYGNFPFLGKQFIFPYTSHA